MYGDVVCDMINHLNNDSIALPCHQRRPWKLSVDTENAPRMAQPRDVEVVYLTFKEERKN
jgi:hypothetical protein